MENINFNLIKKAYPPFLIDKVIKKYLSHTLSSKKPQLKDISSVYYLKLSDQISAAFCTILKINFQNFAKNFVKKILTVI